MNNKKYVVKSAQRNAAGGLSRPYATALGGVCTALSKGLAWLGRLGKKPIACSGPEGACFDGEEKVLVEKWGEIEIQFVTPGMRVLSRCEKTGETAYRDVLQQFCRESVPTYYVWVAEGDIGQPIETTAEHPFWVKGKGWVPVIELQHGDVLENSRGTEITVWKAEPTNRVTTVFNLEVEGFNTYFVGLGGVWVHNCNAPEPRIREVAQKDCGVSGIQNTPCPVKEAIEIATQKAEIKEACFSGDTRVLMEDGKYKKIEYVAVGDKVLSRCEFTGEMAYKKVVKKFHHDHVLRPGDSYGYEIPAYFVRYSTTNPAWASKDLDKGNGVMHAKADDPICFKDYRKWSTVSEVRRGDIIFDEDRAQLLVLRVDMDHDQYHLHWTAGWSSLHVTPEHPIWVEGKGWTAVRDICPGDQFLTSDGAQAIVQQVNTDGETYNVYNLHVEDFHTYFVDSGVWVRGKHE